jgi:hypothetical protein
MWVHQGYYRIHKHLFIEEGFVIRFEMLVRKDGTCVGIGYFTQSRVRRTKRGGWGSVMRERIIARRNQKRKEIILGAPQNRKEKGMGNPSSVRISSVLGEEEKRR